MNTLYTSTLRPGLLVSLKTSVVGNVSYYRQDIESDHLTGDGKRKAKWETERTITDPAEHERAVKVQTKISTLIRGVCAKSAFGLLCPQSATNDLDMAIANARELAEAFNQSATLTQVRVYIMAGQIASNDLEAVKAINSEVRDLLADMQAGVAKLDVEAIRSAATRAKQLGAMLSPEAAARVQVAIDAARSTARDIVKAGEAAAIEVDSVTMRRIAQARTAFLDLDESAPVATPETKGRAIDLDPAQDVPASPAPAPRFGMEF